MRNNVTFTPSEWYRRNGYSADSLKMLAATIRNSLTPYERGYGRIVGTISTRRSHETWGEGRTTHMVRFGVRGGIHFEPINNEIRRVLPSMASVKEVEGFFWKVK